MSTSTNSVQSNQIDPIELLREVAKSAQNGQKETLKQAAGLIKDLQAENTQLRQALEGMALGEAPASVNFKMVHQSTQVESQFTLRGHTDTDLQERMTRRISSLVDSGWIAFDAYVDKRRAERKDAEPAQAPQLAGTPPTCPTHNRPMKPGKNGGWYCSAKIAEDDGTGKPVYCKQKA